MSKDNLYNLTQTSGVYNTTTITDEQYTDVGASAFQLGTVKRLFLGGSDIVIRTAAGGGGTLLVEGSDYDIVNEDFDYTSEIGFHAYTGIEITNVAYQTGDLFITYKTYGSYTDSTILTDIVAIRTHNFLPKSQTVISGSKSTDTGYANYLIKGSSSGDIVVNASTTDPIIIAFADGYDEYGEVNYISKVVTASTGWSGLGSTGDYYLYAQWDKASSSFSYGYSTTVPEYGYVRSTSNPHYYEIPSRKMYKYASTVWTEKCRVFMGEFNNSTGGTSTSNIVTYALNGEYKYFASPSPASNTVISCNHNIGNKNLIVDSYVMNLIPEGNYSAGDKIYWSLYQTGGYEQARPFSFSRNNLTVHFGYNSVEIADKTAGVLTLTSANWSIEITARRIF